MQPPLLSGHFSLAQRWLHYTGSTVLARMLGQPSLDFRHRVTYGCASIVVGIADTSSCILHDVFLQIH